jgi:hypothetical protein
MFKLFKEKKMNGRMRMMHSRWGHAITWATKPAMIAGHLPYNSRLEAGDVVLDSKENMLYQVLKVDYLRDPPDMFFAEVKVYKSCGDVTAEDRARHPALKDLDAAIELCKAP